MMAQGVVSILDSQHYQIVETLWADMQQWFSVGDPEIEAMPHFSYHVAENYEDGKLAEVLQEIAEEKRPFTITTSGIGIFPAPNPIVYAPIVRSPELTRLHARLYTQLEAIAQDSNPYYAPDRWIPHITLGYNNDITLEKLGRISQWLHQQALNWTITIDNIYVLNDDTRSHVEKISVKLGTD
jgi:hypothetical protein